MQPEPEPDYRLLRGVWANMRQRCLNPKRQYFHRYGGRGIIICDEWQTFEPFKIWAIQNGYRPGLSIDRIDNDGPYDPTNCQWITRPANSSKKKTDNSKSRIYKFTRGEDTMVRFPRGTFAQIEELRDLRESHLDFIRAAVKHEIERRAAIAWQVHIKAAAAEREAKSSNLS